MTEGAGPVPTLVPFTFAQAEEIAEDFEDLRDTEFVLGGVLYIVDDVLVCPFGAADKERFYESYLADKEVRLEAGDAGYDVLIAICDPDDQPSYVGIRQFVAEKGIFYNFPEA